MKRILFLSYTGLTDSLGESQVLSYQLKLTAHGFEPYIICAEKKNRLERNRNRIQQICIKNGIKWIPLIYHKRPPVISSIWDYYSFLKTLKPLLKTHNFGLIHCRGYLPSLVGLRLKRKMDIPFLFDMRGFLAR